MISFAAFSDETVEIMKMAGFIGGPAIKAARTLAQKAPTAPTGLIDKIREFGNRHISLQDPVGSTFASKVNKFRGEGAEQAAQAAKSSQSNFLAKYDQERAAKLRTAAEPKVLPAVPKGIFENPVSKGAVKPYYPQFDVHKNPHLMY